MILKRTGVIHTSSLPEGEHDGDAEGRAGSGLTVMRPGTLLQERYEILGILGHGGMSSVYRARDRRFTAVDRLVAIKEMFNITQDAAARRLRLATFEREANLLATLQHPAIPKIHDYFTLDGRIYLVLELIEGQNLETVLEQRGGPIGEAEVIDWGVQVCDLLSYLHGHQPDPIIFRDLKPSNIMLRNQRQIVLVDFGIARTFQGTQRGTMIGTEGYAPPEQYRGLASPTGDIYALGATLHHLATANDPRLETPFTFHQRPPRQLNPGLGEAIEAVLLKAVAYNTSHRYATAEELRLALLAAGAPPTPVVAAPPTPPSAPPPPARKPEATGTVTPRPIRQRVALARSTPSTPTAGSGSLPGGAAGQTERIRWSVRTGDDVRSSPVVHGDHVYVGSYDGNLYAVAVADGSVSWRASGGRGICSTPAVTNDLVVYGSEDHSIYVVDRARGQRVWSYRTGLPVRSSPRVAGGRIFVGSDDGYLYCLDLRNGALVWRTRTWSHVRSSAALAGGLVYVGSDDGYLYAVDADTGSVTWRSQTGGPVIATPYVTDAMVSFGSMDGSIYAIRPESGDRLWRQATGQAVVASVVEGDGVGYIGSVSGQFYALDLANGSVLWRYDDAGQITSTAALDADHVYYGSGDGSIRCLDRVSGELLWQVRTGGPIPSSPCLGHGMLFIGSTDRSLYALTLDEPRSQEDPDPEA